MKNLVSSTPINLPVLFQDRVIQLFLIAIALLAILDTAQVIPSIHFTANAFLEMLPFFTIALLMAAATRASGADSVIAGLFDGKPVIAIFLAASFGSVSPFCSCGVIPIIAALLAARVPLAPVMAFWIASPIIDPEMFILTAAGISGEFAVAKTLAAFLMGLFSGFVISLFSETEIFLNPLKATAYSSATQACGLENCSSNKKPTTKWAFWKEKKRIELFRNEFISTASFLGKWLIVAFFAESLMLAYIPPEAVASAVGGDSWYVIPIAAIIGIPAYLNGYAAIPLVGGLIDLGMSPGAALAFITAGAVSSIPAAMAVFALSRLPVFISYLSLGLVGSIASGYIYQFMVLNISS